MWKCSLTEIKNFRYGTIHKVKRELTFEIPKRGLFKIIIDGKSAITIDTY